MIGTILMASWMLMPAAPLNPIEQDTLSAVNFHVTAGLAGPTSISAPGPEISAKIEVRPLHPLVVRGFADYRFSQVSRRLYPEASFSRAYFLEGGLHSAVVGADALYYRGTDHLTAYVGIGPLFVFNFLNVSGDAQRALKSRFGLNDIDVGDAFGYRLTFGLRINKAYSVELGITEVRPDIVYKRIRGNTIASQSDQVRLGTFQITFGYLWEIKDR